MGILHLNSRSPRKFLAMNNLKNETIMNTPTNGIAHEHIKKLEAQYLCAKNKHNEAISLANSALDEYNNSKAIEALLEGYQKKAEETKTKYGDIKTSLGGFREFVESIFCKFVENSNEATKTVLENIKCLSYALESANERMRKLFELIDCLNNPILSRHSSVLKCLDELKTKTEELVHADLEAAKAIMALLKKLILLMFQVKGGEGFSFGLLSDLKRLEEMLKDHKCNDNANQYGEPERLCENREGISNNILHAFDIEHYLCKTNIDDYFDKIQSRLKKAKEITTEAKKKMVATKEAQKIAESSFNATKAALDAAKAVKDKCK
jgi:hypothetical protein